MHTAPSSASPALDVEIREAHDGDGEAVAGLIRTVFDEYKAEGAFFIREAFPELKSIATYFRNRGGRFWLAHEGNRLIGCFGIVVHRGRGTGEFLKVYLHRDSRGCGVAKRLFDRALHYARDRGIATIELWTDTRFADGHRFYERLGFVRVPGLRAVHDASHSLEYGYRLATIRWIRT